MSTDAIQVGHMPPALDSAPQPQDDRQKALREKGANTALNFLRVPTMIGRASDLTQEVGTHSPANTSSGAQDSTSAVDASQARADAPDSASANDASQPRNMLKTVRGELLPVYDQNVKNEKRNSDIDDIIKDLQTQIATSGLPSRFDFSAVPGLEKEFLTHYDDSDKPAPNTTNDPVNALRRCKRTNEFNFTANVGRLFRSLTEYAAQDLSLTTEDLKASGYTYESKFGIINERNFDTLKDSLGTLCKYVKNIFNRFAFTKFTDSRPTKFFDQIMNEGNRFVVTKALAALASAICGLANLTFAACRILLSAFVVTPSVMVLHLAGGILAGTVYSAYKAACKIYELCGGYNSQFERLALAYILTLTAQNKSPTEDMQNTFAAMAGSIINGENLTKANVDEARKLFSGLEASQKIVIDVEGAVKDNRAAIKGALTNLEKSPS